MAGGNGREGSLSDMIQVLAPIVVGAVVAGLSALVKGVVERRDARVTALRGRVLDVPELPMPVVVTFHPSAVLRAGEQRRRRRAELADDLELARAVARPARRGVETASRG